MEPSTRTSAFNVLTSSCFTKPSIITSSVVSTSIVDPLAFKERLMRPRPLKLITPVCVPVVTNEFVEIEIICVVPLTFKSDVKESSLASTVKLPVKVPLL